MILPTAKPNLRDGRLLLGLPLRAAERIFAALVDPARQNYAIFWVLAGYVVVWTLYGVVSKSTQDIHPDTGELLTWSNELALGYWKHPPFGVYVVRLWTTIFPVEDWSFYLLGMTNAAVAVWVAWRLSASLLSEEKRVVGLAFLTLVPFFNFFSLNYNHNTLLMPLWAMTTLFFLRSFQTRHLGFAALAGLAAGMAMLGKYWTFALLAGLALAALVDPRRRAYFSSAAPYITILAGGGIIAPHLVWLYQNHFTTLVYPAIAHGEKSIVAAGVASLKYFLAFTLYPVVPIAIAAIVTRPSRTALCDTLIPSTLDRRLIAVMFWSPVLLPIPIAILERLHLVTLYTIPALTLLP